METMSATSTLLIHRRPSNYDELSMHQSLLFADCLKDLKNLRTQLYSAAEYFELSYMNDNQQDIVIETAKDYAIKALVNTVDHLGSVTCKVNDLIDAKTEEISKTESRVLCLEKRIRTCREYIDREGIAQQSSVINTPKYHKRYVLPAGQTMNGADLSKLNYKGCDLDEDDWLQLRSAVRATIRDRETDTPSFVRSRRRGRSASPACRPSHLGTSFSFTPTTTTTNKKHTDNRSVSPHRFPLRRSGSFASRPTTPKTSRPTTPNSPHERQQKKVWESWKSVSMRMGEEKKAKELEGQASKSKRLLKSLLSRRKSKKDEILFTYLDEY